MLQMLTYVLIHCLGPSRNLIVFGQCFELAPFGMVGSHVLVLLFLLIRHLLRTVSTVNVPGGFDLKPQDAIWQDHRLLFLYLIDATWLLNCIKAGLLLVWGDWRQFAMVLLLLGSVGDVEVFIMSTLPQIYSLGNFGASLYNILLLCPGFWCLWGGMRLTKLDLVSGRLQLAIIKLLDFYSHCPFSRHCSKWIWIFKFWVFL